VDIKCVISNRFVRLAIAALLLVLIFYFVPVTAVLNVLRDASVPLMLVAIAAQFANRWLATVPLQVIARGQGVTLQRSTLYQIVLAVQFYALFLPGALSGGAATWLKFVDHGVSRVAAAAMVVLNRAAGLLVLLPCASVALLIDTRHGIDSRLPMAGLLGTVAILVFLYWSPEKEPESTPRSATTNRGLAIARGVLQRVEGFRGMSRMDRSRVLAGALFTELANAGAMWLFALAIGLAIAPSSALWMRCMLQLMLLLPFTIAGLGVREVSLMALCALIGIPANAAVAWSLAILGGTVSVALLGGWIEFRTAHHPANLSHSADSPRP
jgi:glycosyltransferase 2 family protein